MARRGGPAPRTSGGEQGCTGRPRTAGPAGPRGPPPPPAGAAPRRAGGPERPATTPGGASAVLGGGSVLRAADVDVGRARERRRQRRLGRLALVLWVATIAAWWRVLTGGSLNPLDGVSLGPEAMLWLPAGPIVP